MSPLWIGVGNSAPDSDPLQALGPAGVVPSCRSGRGRSARSPWRVLRPYGRAAPGRDRPLRLAPRCTPCGPTSGGPSMQQQLVLLPKPRSYAGSPDGSCLSPGCAFLAASACRAPLFAPAVWNATASARFDQLLWSRSRSRCGLAGKSGADVAVGARVVFPGLYGTASEARRMVLSRPAT